MHDKDKVKVVRVLEYVGTREEIARTLDNSIKGETGHGGLRITETALGDPIVLERYQELDPTQEALEKSIVKWVNVCFLGVGERGVSDCALCMKFKDSQCEGCPVKNRTGLKSCRKTPYPLWEIHHHSIHKNQEPKNVKCGTCKNLALQELDFLKSLRKEV
jgi:hypothetical protein